MASKETHISDRVPVKMHKIFGILFLLHSRNEKLKLSATEADNDDEMAPSTWSLVTPPTSKADADRLALANIFDPMGVIVL